MAKRITAMSIKLNAPSKTLIDDRMDFCLFLIIKSIWEG